MRAAMHFFHHGPQLPGHPQSIFGGDSAAGGFMALLTAHMDTPTEVPTYLGLTDLGGLARYGSRPRGIGAMCGALVNLRWLQPSDVPGYNSK